MKTLSLLTLLLALLGGAFAQVPATLPKSKAAQRRPSVNPMDQQARMSFVQSGAMQADGKEIYALTGIPEDAEAKKAGSPSPFLRPQAAEEITVIVYTADGRKWQARWVEVKN
jgi:hypothetical protein